MPSIKLPQRFAAKPRKWGITLLGAVVATLCTLPAVTGPDVRAQAREGDVEARGLQGFRRLNEGQYVRSIEQIFGPGIKVPGRFEPPLREGLMAIGDARVTVTPSGIEQYELRAREIAAQVLAPERRKALMPCTPRSEEIDDAACTSQFFTAYGRQLYRRPLSQNELNSVVALSARAAGVSGNFYKGLEIGLSRLLVSPKFIFRVERSEADPVNQGTQRLDDYVLATRISFLLWDASPDVELLDAVARGDLRDDTKLAGQVDRMIASPRFEQGVRSFFADMFGYEQFQGLAKDQAIYPKFNSDLLRDAQEQTMLTIIDHVIARKGDYRDLFTTRQTFINRSLGALYKVPVTEPGMAGWAPYTFPEGSQRLGILSLAAFLMLDPTHEGRSSPTIRGKTVRELLLCQPVPQPPANVDFAIVQDVSNPLYKTARQRLSVHMENPACKGCHALTDPIGLSMENYDAVGSHRTHENEAAIDASGAFGGKPYVGLTGLAGRLRESPEIPACLVQRAYEYGVGREALGTDEAWLEMAGTAFAAKKYRFPDLMRWIATNPAFAKMAPEPSAGTGKIAAR